MQLTSPRTLAFVVATAVVATASGAATRAFAAPSGRPASVGTRTVGTATPRRVLLIGDSVMNQQGEAAALVLRQAGVDARAVGYWGTSLLTRGQYDFGHTIHVKPAGNTSWHWLSEADRLVNSFDPDVVAVYLNHNYWPPFPRDSGGRVIGNVHSAAFRSMVNQQVEALIRILQRRGAVVTFVAPLPTTRRGDPERDNQIWAAYQPAIRRHHLAIIDSEVRVNATRRRVGGRVETMRDCHGVPERVRPDGDLHLTRYGAGLAGTGLAGAIAALLGVNLHDMGAPGDHVGGFAPVSGGYLLVGCDGSVYQFGTRAASHSARWVLRKHYGVRDAFATPSGAGLEIVAGDGTIIASGDAIPLTLDHVPPLGVVSAAATPGANGVFALSVDGTVAVAGDAVNAGPATGSFAKGYARGICATPNGLGYWVVYSSGALAAYGDAADYGHPTAPLLTAPLVGCAATPTGNGYWLLSSDGRIYAYGDAHNKGNAVYHPRTDAPKPLVQWLTAHKPRPTHIVAAPGPAQGYWIVSDQGQVFAFGSAQLATERAGHSGTNNLALLTE